MLFLKAFSMINPFPFCQQVDEGLAPKLRRSQNHLVTTG
jgi:hypothetical protein